MNTETLKSFCRDVTLKIPAGESKLIPVTGNFFYIEEADGLALMRYENSEGEFRAPVATGQDLEPGELFTGLEVNNPSATETLNMIIKVGRGMFHDNRTTAVAGRANLIMPQRGADLSYELLPVAATKVSKSENPLRDKWVFVVTDGCTVVVEDLSANQIYVKTNHSGDTQTYEFKFSGACVIDSTGNGSVGISEISFSL